jgi:amino acid permease
MVGLPEAWNGRKSNIIVIATAFLLPMSLIKNLSALAFTSILGFCAIMYTVLFINYRALDGSYKIGSGKFVTDGVLKVLPSFEKSSLWNINFSSLVLASNLGLAYVAHYNSPSMYRELKDTNSKRYSKMVNIAYTLLIMLYLITMGGGYSTFGDNT